MKLRSACIVGINRWCHVWGRRSSFKRVIVITGTPGVGKTVVSALLARRLGASHVDLAEVVKREKLTAGFDRQRGTLIADEDRLKSRVRELVEQSADGVVVDGHYAAFIVPKRQITRALVLRCHPRELRERMMQRGFEGTKLWENLAAEILDVCLFETVTNAGQNRVCEVDTTSKSAVTVVDEIVSILGKNGKCLVGIVDWLAKLEEEKSLDQYLGPL